MKQLLQILLVGPFLVLCFQMYSFSVTREGVERQNRCQWLGGIYMTIGTVALVFHSTILAFTGVILLMIGFRLLAKGLDRINKKVFIDQCDDDR